MAKVVSCGVVILNVQQELFLCHATGTTRWDLPKGVEHPGELPVRTAVREAWEETSLLIEPETLADLGVYDYLPAKRLHLFALRVSVEAFDIGACRCHTSFPHHGTGLATLEVDAYAWVPLNQLGAWCGKNMTRVLTALDWRHIERLPEIVMVPVDTD